MRFGNPRHHAHGAFGIGGPTLITATMGLLVYRAATQSITYDEACTYLEFVSGPLGRAFTTYTANNHILFTVLAKLSTSALGASELSLRLPTLFGAALYLGGAYLTVQRVFGNRGEHLLLLATLVLNPFLLDFLCAARGYGLALGWLGICLVLLADVLSARKMSSIDLSCLSGALGLMVASNLSFLSAALPLGMCVGSIVLVRHGCCWRRLICLCAPGVLIA